MSATNVPKEERVRVLLLQISEIRVPKDESVLPVALQTPEAIVEVE